MRHWIAIAAAALLTGFARADEPAACYVYKDPTGDFVPRNVQALGADPALAGQITHLINENNRATGKCMQRFIKREGAWPNGAGVLYGARVSPAGKVTQVSVLAVNNLNDNMLMACIARTICEWELEPDADGRERLVELPPYVLADYGGRR
ncbi:hypothetical protein [Massilia putida]|uniref:hypothetical protein n=1 Tax=Massilia putida TaxID=1141883 RepID=UPI0009519E0F|nr:hypothetical protein [Massilia putida]